MKKGKMLGIVLMVALMLTGCVDNMPSMTEEQSELVAEYAAGLLLKYSPNYDYGLADDEELLEEESTEMMTEVESEEESTEETSEEASSEEKSEEVTTEINIHVGEDKADSDIKYIPVSNSETIELKENPYEVELAEVLDTEDMGIRYTYYEICKEYPSGSSASGFTVQPQEGKQLLVIHFNLENTKAEAQECDLFDQTIKIKLNLNDTGFKKTSSTLLMNDITTYIEEIAAGEVEDVVTVMEVDVASEEEITSLNLLIECGDNKCAMKLK